MTKGCMIVVVGASGAGKDTVIRNARKKMETLDKVRFIKRVVTRPCDPQREVHDSVTAEQFIENSSNGEYAVEWKAHGLYYGIPRHSIQHVANGEILVVNGSRDALTKFRTTYSRCLVIWITAPIDVLAERLLQRNAENAESIKQRLRRSVTHNAEHGDIVIDNTGHIDTSVAQFIKAVEDTQKAPQN